MEDFWTWNVQLHPNSTETVREALLMKHPPGKPLTQSAIVTMYNPIDELHPVLFDRSDGDLIQSTALNTGAAWPPGLDAAAWALLLSQTQLNYVMP